MERMKEKGEEKKPDLKEELESIYTDRHGNLPDFTRLEGKPTSRFRSFAVGVLFFLAVLAGVTWAGIFWFSKNGGGFTGEHVEVSVRAEDSFTSGAETEVLLHYKNGERVPLASAVLTATLPEAFVLLDAEPRPNEDGEWEIGSVAPGGEGAIRLRGWIRSEPEDALLFSSKLRYKPADFNSPFESVATRSVAVAGSVLEIEAEGPEKMTPGEEIEFVYRIRNSGDRAHAGLVFALDAPEGFLFSSASPAPEIEGGRTWSLPVLEAEGEMEVAVRGTFTAASRGPKRIPARVGFRPGEALISLASGAASTEVLKSDLALGLIVNGAASDATVAFGELLNFTLTYRNDGDVALRDVALSLELPADPAELIDWVTLRDDLGGRRSGAVITWMGKEIEALSQLDPGEGGTVDLSVRLSKKPVQGKLDSPHALTAKLSAVIGRVGTLSGPREVAGAPIAIRLNSDTVFRAFGRYYTEDGLPLGSGPLPPRVGERTTYRIFWVVENSLHELTNLSVETILPQGVRWTGEARPVEAGELSFDESGRRAVWRLNRLPVSVNRLIVTFDVELVPAFEDIGRIVEITGDNRFEALDRATGSVILITERPVDTSLPADDDAAGKGTVRG